MAATSGGQNEHPREKTGDKLAEQAGVGQATIRRWAKDAKAIEDVPELEKHVLAGKLKLGDAATALFFNAHIIVANADEYAAQAC